MTRHSGRKKNAWNTVDGRNPAPPGMQKTLQIMGSTIYQLVSRISSINSMFLVFGKSVYFHSESMKLGKDLWLIFVQAMNDMKWYWIILHQLVNQYSKGIVFYVCLNPLCSPAWSQKNPGDQLWRHIVKPYSGLLGQAAGDFEGSLERLTNGLNPICLPATWWWKLGSDKHRYQSTIETPKKISSQLTGAPIPERYFKPSLQWLVWLRSWESSAVHIILEPSAVENMNVEPKTRWIQSNKKVWRFWRFMFVSWMFLFQFLDKVFIVRNEMAVLLALQQCCFGLAQPNHL